MDRSVVLSVGDKHRLAFGKGVIYYAGMPSEKVFLSFKRNGDFRIRVLPGTCFSL